MNRLRGLAAILALVGAGLLIERLRFRSYWRRACSGPAWKSRYPDASKTEIREFLQVFVRAFGFRQSRTLKFEPADRVVDILSRRYPPYLSQDPLELDDFVQLVHERYGVDLKPAWHESITLGDIFETTRRRVA